MGQLAVNLNKMLIMQCAFNFNNSGILRSRITNVLKIRSRPVNNLLLSVENAVVLNIFKLDRVCQNLIKIFSILVNMVYKMIVPVYNKCNFAISCIKGSNTN